MDGSQLDRDNADEHASPDDLLYDNVIQYERLYVYFEGLLITNWKALRSQTKMIIDILFVKNNGNTQYYGSYGSCRK